MQNSIAIGIVAKPAHARARELTERLITWCKDRSLNYKVDRATAEALGYASVDKSNIIPRQEITVTCDLIVVLGGDGTLISVCRHATDKTPKIVGVNLGTLGFLTEITINELFPTLDAVLDNKATLQRRRLLTAEVFRREERVAQFNAINDIVITKDALARIFSIDWFVNRTFAATIRGDGVIVATPSGSTAYSLAAGGSIVHPEVDAILVTPICPHSLTTRPVVLPGNSEISLQTWYEGQANRKEIHLTIDGQEGILLDAGDTVVVTTSKQSVQFVKSPSKSYFDVLGTKLKWAVQ